MTHVPHHGLQPGFLGLEMVDAGPGTPPFPWAHAEQAIARTLARADHGGLVALEQQQGTLHLQAHWTVKADGLCMTALLLANAHHGIVRTLTPDHWGMAHLGYVPWGRFPPGEVVRARTGWAAYTDAPVVHGKLDCTSAHKRLAWRAWCVANRHGQVGGGIA